MTPKPVAPGANQGLFESMYAGPAISICDHGIDLSTNCCRNIAAVMEPP